MSTWTDEELAHERSMREDGEVRYQVLAQRARERGELTLLPSGRALVRDAIQPVARALEAWLERASGSAGPAHDVAPLLAEVRPEVLAMLAVTAVVDGLHRPRPLTSVLLSIGRAVEDEVRFRELRRREPDLWAEVMLRTRRSTPSHRRATVVRRGNKAGVLPVAWAARDRLRVGSVLAELVRAETGFFEVRTIKTFGPRSRSEVVPTVDVLEWLQEADQRAAVLCPLYMPTLVPPAPWEGPEGGGYHTDVVLRRPIARFRGHRHKVLVDERGPGGPVLAAMNTLQSVPWVVNEDLLEAVEGAPLLLPGTTEEPVPPRPPDIDTNEPARRAWRRSARAIRDRNVVRRSRAVGTVRTLQVARRLAGRTLYYPHRLDFRGRAYPIPHWLSPQGGDLDRALLRFAEGCPADPHAVLELERYAARLYGEEGGLGPIIGAIGEDPLEASHLWTGADEPLQFLAAALELYDAAEGRSERLRTPIHLDASNNGLQLYALLTGDRALAASTNAIGTGGPPRDLYTEVASAASAVLLSRYDSDEPARRWVDALAPLVRAGGPLIPRALAKRPVMTLPYGVTRWSAQRYVRDWHDETFGDASPLGYSPGKLCGYLAGVVMGEVEQRCLGAVLGMRWLREVALMVAKTGIPVRWTAASGWPVQQEYRKGGALRVRATVGGAVRHLRLRTGRGTEVDPIAQARGVPPNFVHSVDAAILHKFLEGWGDAPVTAVHDSFGVLARDVPQASDGLRSTVADLTTRRDLFSEFREEVAAYSRLDLPTPPRLGTIEPQEVLAAEHLYS